MSGSFSVSREIWSHPAFKAEPFTEREAWVWLFGNARYKPGVVRAGDLIVPVERGEVVASTRFAAKAWRWTDSKVRRFYERLEKLEMIALKTDAGVTVVTICNYDDYQPGGAGGDAGPTQDRRRTDAKENKDEIRVKEEREDTYVSLAASPPQDPVPANEVSTAVSRYNDAAEKAGWPKIQTLNPNRSKQIRARLRDCGGVDGWEVALRKAFSSDFLRGRTAKPWTGFCFDWLVKSQNFTKLMEGNYDNRIDSAADVGFGLRGHGSGTAQAFAAVAERRSAGQG